VAFELPTQPTFQLSLSKQTAFPRKSRYDKGKSKISNNLLGGPTIVGPLGAVRVTDKEEKITILDLLIGTRPSKEVTVPFEESGSLVPMPLPIASLPQTSLAIIPFEHHVVGETLEPEHDELVGVEPFIAEEIEGSGAFLPRPEFITAEATDFSKENLTGGRASIKTLMTFGPTRNRILEETIKLTEEPLSRSGSNWLGNPFVALAGLIPATSMVDVVALSPKETMEKMTYHFLDVSFLSLHFDHTPSQKTHASSFGFIGSYEGYGLLLQVSKAYECSIAENEFLKKWLKDSNINLARLQESHARREKEIAENDLAVQAKIRDLESKLEVAHIITESVLKDHSVIRVKFTSAKVEANWLNMKLLDATNEMAVCRNKANILSQSILNMKVKFRRAKEKLRKHKEKAQSFY
jgi:hypothetical protein